MEIRKKFVVKFKLWKCNVFAANIEEDRKNRTQPVQSPTGLIKIDRS